MFRQEGAYRRDVLRFESKSLRPLFFNFSKQGILMVFLSGKLYCLVKTSRLECMNVLSEEASVQSESSLVVSFIDRWKPRYNSAVKSYDFEFEIHRGRVLPNFRTPISNRLEHEQRNASRECLSFALGR